MRVPTIGEAQRTPLRAKLEQHSSEAEAQKAHLKALPRQLWFLLQDPKSGASATIKPTLCRSIGCLNYRVTI